MRIFGREIKGYPKALVVLAAIFLVSTGLCGLQVLIADVPGNDVAGIFMISGVIELIVMAASMVGIVAVLIVWPIAILYARHARPPKDRVQALFEREDKTDRQDSE